jgi:5-methylcytosine-specific restriction endonuclease McrA
MDALMDKVNLYLTEAGKDILLSRTRDRLGGGVVKTLRAFLFEYSNGICIVCEQECTLDPGKENSAEAGHIIPASHYTHSDNRAGYAPGNVATMCKECNRNAKDFPFHLHLDKVRADLIPTEWPSMYKKAWTPKDTHGERAFAIRKGKGLPF